MLLETDLKLKETNQRSSPAANGTFAVGGVSFTADSFMVAESLVLRIKSCAEKPAHPKSTDCCLPFY